MATSHAADAARREEDGSFFFVSLPNSLPASFLWSLLSSRPALSTLPVPLLLADRGPDKAALWSPAQRSDNSFIPRETEATSVFPQPDLLGLFGPRKLHYSFFPGSLCLVLLAKGFVVWCQD